MTASPASRRDFEMSENENREQRQTRAAVNESRHRNLNEKTEKGREGAVVGEYVCECARATCDSVLSMSVEEYEAVRKVSTHFAVASGHSNSSAEQLVRETPRYQVVEKIGTAGRVAAQADPRRLDG
jgi:hypothetical protein